MKSIIFKFLLLFIFTFLFSRCNYYSTNSENSDTPNWTTISNIPKGNEIQNFVVLELFSSESCYDCPMSEYALNKTTDSILKNNLNIIAIAEHVDYWNDLVDGEGDCNGNWVDKYSTGIFTARQFAYGNKLQIRPATPQLIINGIDYINDPDQNDINTKIQEYIENKPTYGILIEFNKEKTDFTNNKLAIDFNIKLQKDVSVKFRENMAAQLQVFLIESNIISRPLKSHFIY